MTRAAAAGARTTAHCAGGSCFEVASQPNQCLALREPCTSVCFQMRSLGSGSFDSSSDNQPMAPPGPPAPSVDSADVPAGPLDQPDLQRLSLIGFGYIVSSPTTALSFRWE